jgi:hypothetical protein
VRRRFSRFPPSLRPVQERHSSWPILSNSETGHFTTIVDGNLIKSARTRSKSSISRGAWLCWLGLVTLVRTNGIRDAVLPTLVKNGQAKRSGNTSTKRAVWRCSRAWCCHPERLCCMTSAGAAEKSPLTYYFVDTPDARIDDSAALVSLPSHCFGANLWSGVGVPQRRPFPA